MNSTLSPPDSTQQRMQGPLSPVESGSEPKAYTWLRHPSLPSIGALLLILGITHFALIPGFVLGGQRFGWHDKLWPLGGVDPLLTWPLASILIALAVLYYIRAALRPLGPPFGPRSWMHRMFKAAHPPIPEMSRAIR